MKPNDPDLAALDNSSEALEPLDAWVHVQPSLDEEKKGRIYLPVNVEGARLTRCVVLATGSEVTDLQPGDLILSLAAKAIDLRDGSQLVPREYVVAKLG